ncbi:hypothetical protein [Metaclostridioides mangenotii]|uniref:hypothetical protein n=1 Tax=Metaclostridioides mangenotii TaxID=1540 RepID=UPI0004644DC8|nr:hypothetical protein [Clostridioides mangenotii]
MAKKAELEKKETAVIANFTKEQLVNAKKYSNRRDILNALLEADKLYSFGETDELINKFEKKKVI